jgi:predicted lipid-binding transport protein (Tim44 family)
MNNTIIQLLVLAGVALFLIIRLRNVLGTRDGFEPKNENNKTSKLAEKDNLKATEDELAEDITDYLPGDKNSAEALKKIKHHEPEFSLTEFIGGAATAYEMILMAFQAGDIESVDNLLGAEVKSNFGEAISDRKQKGLVIESDFIGLRDTAIKSVFFNVEKTSAEISVSFLADIKSVVKNNDGDIIEGENAEIKKQFDIWVFSREVGSDSPNWLLIETGS